MVSDGIDEVDHGWGNKRWRDPPPEERLNQCLRHWWGHLDHSMPPINTLDGYGTNCTDRWRYIKTPLQSRRRYLKETLTPQRLEPKATCIKPSTLPWKGTENINLRKRETIGHSLLFCIHSIILFWLWHQSCFGRHHTGDHLQQKRFPWLYRYPSWSPDPSGYASLDWRSYASSVWCRLWGCFLHQDSTE